LVIWEAPWLILGTFLIFLSVNGAYVSEDLVTWVVRGIFGPLLIFIAIGILLFGVGVPFIIYTLSITAYEHLKYGWLKGRKKRSHPHYLILRQRYEDQDIE
jgi:hypothetical protein